MHERIILELVAIVVFAGAARWLAWRLRFPAILLLLFGGFVAGPLLQLIHPDQLFGPLLLPFVSFSVALVLYEGGLNLNVRELPAIGPVLRRLLTLGAVVTWFVSSIAAWLVFNLEPGLAFLLGAILVVTGPTVIHPLLQFIRPVGPSGAILRWEGIVIDPIGATLAVLVFEFLSAQQLEDAAINVVLGLLKTLIIGGGFGFLGAAALAFLIYRYWVPDFLHNAASLVLVFAAFSGSNALQHESGLLAVTVMGIVLANQRYADVRHIAAFKEDLQILLISVLFIVLAARIPVQDIQAVAAPGFVFLLILIFIARPLSVAVSVAGSSLRRRDRWFIAGLAPRGIVAAAVSTVFAIRLEESGYQQARLLVPILFLVITGTVLVYGLGSPVLARRLGLSFANPQGILFVGSAAWVRAVADVLRQQGISVVLVDTRADNVDAARALGLTAHAGNVLDEDLASELDLGGIGRLLAVTPNEYVNVLAVQRFRHVFGRPGCYQLPPKKPSPSQQRPLHAYGRPLFAEGAVFRELDARFAAGAEVVVVPFNATADYAAFQEVHGRRAIPLFMLSGQNSIQVVTADRPVSPLPGQSLIALVSPLTP
jgi:NhaP-type Na+/H+ or K+/H+ antiporter/Trk K+ transport system NAD-binding subunit